MKGVVDGNLESSQPAGAPLSVAVCTRNRPEDLRLCLSALSMQDASRDRYEVIVVDNGPDAVTESVVQDFADGSMNLRYVVEPRLGLANARRRALEVSTAEYVGYVDDDAVVCPGWVSVALSTFEQGPDSLGLLGGPVLNVSQLSEPWPFTASPGQDGLDLGSRPRSLELGEHLWGCNLVFRRSALQEVSAFEQSLGHRGTRPGANEDVYVQYQLEGAGFDRRYEPGLQIVHCTWRTRAGVRELDRLAFWTGVDDALMKRLIGSMNWSSRRREVGHWLGRLRAQTAAAVAAQRSGASEEFISARRAALRSVGVIRGMVWPPRV